MTFLPSFALAALAGLAAEPGGSDCNGTVAGQIVDVATGEAIPEARVELLRGQELLQRVESDEMGRFRIEALCPGDARLRAERADYENSARSLRVASRDAEITVDLALEPRAVERIDDVVVEAPAPGPSDARASSTLDGEALEDARGQNLADAMARLPGTAVLRSAAGGMGKPIIRGQIGRRNLILFDGIRHEGQKWGIDHAPEIDPFAAGSLTVIRGAGTTRYGPDAVGGVVLVDPHPLRLDPGIRGQAHLVGESNGLRGSAALRLDGAHAEAPGFAWRVDGNVSRGGDLVAPDYPLENTASLVWNAGGAATYVAEDFDLRIGYRHHFTKAGICLCQRLANQKEFDQAIETGRPINAELYKADYKIARPFQEVAHDLAHARANVKVGNAGTLGVLYAFQDNRRKEYDLLKQVVTWPQLVFDLRTHSTELTFAHRSLELGRGFALEGTAGTQLAAQTNEFEAQTTLIPDYEQFSGGLFVIERVVSDVVEFEAGGRYDGLVRDSFLYDQEVYGFVGKLDECDRHDGGADCRHRFHAGSGSAGAVVRPVPSLPGFDLRLDLASAARFPSIDESFMNGSAPSLPVTGLGDPELGVERTWGSSVTLNLANHWVAAQGSVYYNYIDDYIYFAGQPQSPEDSDCAPFTCQANGAVALFAFERLDAHFWGGEVGATIAPPDWPVEFDLQASFVRAQEVEVGHYLSFIPPDRYRAGVKYRWPPVEKRVRGHVGVEGQFIDKQRRWDEDADFAPPPPAYFLLGASAGVEVQVDTHVLRFSAVGANLLNTEYRDYTSLMRYFADEPGWNLILRIGFDFDVPLDAPAPGA